MCNNCNKPRKDTFKNFDITNPTASNKAVAEQRLNICRNCGSFKPTSWLCLLNSLDVRLFIKVLTNNCPAISNRW